MSNIYVGTQRGEPTRISCPASLRYRLLTSQEFAAAVDNLDKKRQRLHLLDLLTQPSQEELDRFIAIGKESPLVARHLQGMAEKLDAVGKLLATEDDQLSNRPTHNIMISTDELLFHAPTPFYKRAVMEIQLRLFPQKRRILLITETVSADETQAGTNNYNVANRISYIAEQDKEFFLDYISQRAHKHQEADE